MQSFAATVVLVVALSCLSVVVAEDENVIAYYLYFSDDKCETDTAGIVAKVADEPFLGVGGLSPAGKCSEEVVCLMDNESDLCQSLNRTNSGNGSILVDDFGVIVECKWKCSVGERVSRWQNRQLTFLFGAGDSSNTDNPVCGPIPDECDKSSIYPNCYFRLRTMEQLKADPSVIQTMNEAEEDTHAYLVYYEDDQCADIQAIDAMASDKSMATFVDSSVSCNAAVTCAVEPNGESCQNISEEHRTNSTIDLKVTADGILVCIEDGSCEFAPTGCVKSDLLESCYVKWISPTDFFNDPGATLFQETPLQIEKPDEEEEQEEEEEKEEEGVAEVTSGSFALPLGSAFAALVALFAV